MISEVARRKHSATNDVCPYAVANKGPSRTVRDSFPSYGSPPNSDVNIYGFLGSFGAVLNPGSLPGAQGNGCPLWILM